MEKRLTKKDYFGMIREVVADNEELVAFVDHELELLNKKSSARTQTKTQQANEDLKTQIIEELTRIGEKVTISDLQAQSEILSKDNYSNQKISALLKQLVNSGEVAKEVDKKKSYFFIAE